MTKLPPMTRVESSNIEAMGWTDKGGMFVRFKGGGVYSYPEVPHKEYVAGVAEDSIGRWFSYNIRGKYRHIQHKDV